jgi:hypothetical protein
MKRLSELPADDRLTARAHTLIRAVGPTLESDERLLRVRRSLDAPVRAATPRWVWQVGLAVALVGLGAGAAISSGRAGPPAAHPVQIVTAAPAVLSAAVLPGVARAERALTSAPSRAPSPRAAVPPLSDVARVHEAAKALRHDGDAQRALHLLEGAPVTGPLAEEALALRIEASAARGDGRKAKLAAAYLAQYPNGRYRELAKKALSGSQP